MTPQAQQGPANPHTTMPTSLDTFGIDFGTTNSAVARTTTSGLTDVAWFPTLSGATEVYRSILYFEQLKAGGATERQAWTGPAAIEHYPPPRREAG